ncbi:MucR family transcriptional regulator [uncultured Algimonas sp.]|uniref:MucR family transcriptional regulator n=1 Tax=uncultured Algimonas sp. TaxID=1547920 RepID=UPI00262BA36D|nr:MucR family transcriptional regulator [uncultured Algimonas sp.]
MSPDDRHDPLLGAVARVLAAYVRNHEVAPDALPGLARTIRRALAEAADAPPAATGQAPAVPIGESVTDSHLICLEDGKPYQSLKRHLRVAYGLSPEDYRRKWGLPPDYPMVAPAYARRRSALAKRAGLGKTGRNRP